MADSKKIFELIELLEETQKFWFDIDFNWCPRTPRDPTTPNTLYEISSTGGQLLRRVQAANPNLIPQRYSSKLFELRSIDECSEHGDADFAPSELWVEALNLLEANVFRDFWKKQPYWREIQNENKLYSEEGEGWKKSRRLNENFYNKCVGLASSIYSCLRAEIKTLDSSSWPVAIIAVVACELRFVRLCFQMFWAKARGPYLPDKEDIWFNSAGSVGVKLGSARGVLELKCRYPIGVDCCFFSTNIGPVSWGEEWWGADSYENELFYLWDYENGEYARLKEAEWPLFWSLPAKWYIDEAGAVGLETEAKNIEEELQPLFEIESQRDLAKETLRVVRNNLAKWTPREVQWSYIKQLDDVIGRLTVAYKQPSEGTRPEGKTKPVERALERIPAEFRSLPMSQTELAELFGGNITQKTIKLMIKTLALHVIPMSRQRFIFDKRDLPPNVINKLGQIK